MSILRANQTPGLPFTYSRNCRRAAVREGFKLAGGDIILIQDADLEYDPQDYLVLLEPILKGQADVVYGSRFIGGARHRVDLFWHTLGNKLVTLISNMLCLHTGIVRLALSYSSLGNVGFSILSNWITSMSGSPARQAS